MRTNSSSGYHFSEQFACEAKLRPLRHRCALRPPGQQCLKRYLRCRPGLQGSPGRDISLRLGSSRSPLQFGPSSGIFWAKVCKHIKSRLYDTKIYIFHFGYTRYGSVCPSARSSNMDIPAMSHNLFASGLCLPHRRTLWRSWPRPEVLSKLARADLLLTVISLLWLGLVLRFIIFMLGYHLPALYHNFHKNCV